MNEYYLVFLVRVDEKMADNLEKGILCIIAAVFFLFSGIEILDLQVFDPGFSMILAFICLAVGMYFITKK